MKVQSQHDKCLSCLSPDKCCLSHCLPLNLPSGEAFTTISSHFRAKHILYLIMTCKLIKAFTSIMLHLALKYPPGSPHCSYNKNNITFCREDLFGLSAAPLNLISLFLLHQFLFSHIELLAAASGCQPIRMKRQRDQWYGAVIKSIRWFFMKFLLFFIRSIKTCQHRAT